MPGTFDDVNCVSPTPTTSSSGGGGALVDFKDYNGRSWSRSSRSSSALDRHSESSESLDNQSTSSGNGRQMQDFGSSEYIPTRSTKTAPKVAYNPMQFVKTGPTKLAQTAQEQLKKAEEVKKIRETKKDDQEDWQSNLEGWKSSRRKRQEHVIERVTEVKRMEQEEALKASEAAAKRLIGIREKRGKLSALYSVEDNDEIEFDQQEPMSPSSSVCQDDGPQSPPHHHHHDDDSVFIQKSDEKTESVAPSKSKDAKQQSPEYTYDKAIQDYVKYSTTALHSKQDVAAADTPTTISSSTTTKKHVVKAETTTKPLGPPERKSVSPARDDAIAATADTAAMMKRRSVFEREESTSREESLAAAQQRRSGEFSSTFKTRLSTFEIVDNSNSTTAPPPPPVKVNTTFKNKIASFQAEPQPPEIKPPPTTVVQESGNNQDIDQGERLDFKAKLAAFRQVEAQAEPLPPPPPPPVVKMAAKPAPVVQTVTAPVRQPPVVAAAEPIYANSSIAAAQQQQNNLEPFLVPRPSAADPESDCTEDEGIRSLSPHGTPSPTSPTEPAESLPQAESYDFQLRNSQENSLTDSAESGTATTTTASAWPPSEVVWDGQWVDPLGPVRNVAPPSEKPPPPPPGGEDGDAQDADKKRKNKQATTTPGAVAIAETKAAYSRGPATASVPTDANIRQELRKRRSDFLGFDVNAMEDDAKEIADAIPPPPDLKTLLRQSASDYRLMTSPTTAPDDDELERKEREIIETLEKEEQERMSSSSASAHDRSHDGPEYEMTAEIDQLAREWQMDAMGVSSWKTERMSITQPAVSPQSPPKFQPVPEEIILTPPPPPVVQQQLKVEVTPPPPLKEKVTQQQQQQQQHSPPKPSRLSAAPKPRLHDGEAWMAKRKVASEGQPAPRKDVSHHWLIQEAEQRRIEGAMQERNYSPASSMSSSSVPPIRHGPGGPAATGSTADGSHWMSRSSSSTSMDKMSELLRLPSSQQHSRSASSLGSSPTSPPRPLYANQEEILEYADFTGAIPQHHSSAPPVWQVRSLVNSGSMDRLQSISPPGRPLKPINNQQSQSQTLNPAQMQPSWRSSGHPPETSKEPIAPLPQTVINTLTQRMAQRSGSGSNLNNNYSDYMNLQEAVGVPPPPPSTRAGPQVPAQRPTNYRHPSLGPSQSAPGGPSLQPQQQQQNNNDRMLSVSGKKKCSLCQEELGRGAAMIIESLRLFYHIHCFRCCVCGIALGNGTAGTDVRVRNNNLHCHDCYSNDDGLKFSKV